MAASPHLSSSPPEPPDGASPPTLPPRAHTGSQRPTPTQSAQPLPPNPIVRHRGFVVHKSRRDALPFARVCSWPTRLLQSSQPTGPASQSFARSLGLNTFFSHPFFQLASRLLPLPFDKMPSAASVMRAAVLAGVASALPELAPRQMVTNSCADVHIFLGKGNNEPYPGRQGKLVSAICSGLSSCDYEDIQMQNMLEDEFCGAVTQGITNGHAQIVAYNKRCPNSKIVVSGFSQGAQVVGDIFSGAGNTGFNGCVIPFIPALDITSNAGRQVAAILTFGDIRHTAFQPYNYKSGATNWGTSPRTTDQLAKAMNYAGVWRDYCNAGDPVCAGGNVVDEHLNYFDVDTPDAAAFVQRRIAAFQGPVKSSTPAPGPTPAPTTRSPFTNGTMTTSSPGSTVLTVTDVSGAVTVYTTVCPETSYTENAHTVTPPAGHSPTVKLPLPEATCETTENLSAIPTTAAPTSAPAVQPTGGVVKPASSVVKPTGGVVKPTPSQPVLSGASATGAGFFGLAAAIAALALL
ncbi:hypothetical protein RB597_007594 [Gaeumannomyces tritici]